MDNEEDGARDYGPPPPLELIQKISAIVDGERVDSILWALANVMGKTIGAMPERERPMLTRAAIDALLMTLEGIHAVEAFEAGEDWDALTVH